MAGREWDQGTPWPSAPLLCLAPLSSRTSLCFFLILDKETKAPVLFLVWCSGMGRGCERGFREALSPALNLFPAGASWSPAPRPAAPSL